MLIHSTAVGYSVSLYHSIYHGALLYNGKLEMGKNTNLGFAFRFGFFGDKGSVLSGSEYF